jgi:hypothetical protein
MTPAFFAGIVRSQKRDNLIGGHVIVLSTRLQSAVNIMTEDRAMAGGEQGQESVPFNAEYAWHSANSHTGRLAAVHGYTDPLERSHQLIWIERFCEYL